MNITIADLIKTHRQKSGMTQLQLATMAGVGKTVIFDIEHGKESVKLTTLQKVFKVLNIHLIAKSPFGGEAEIGGT